MTDCKHWLCRDYLKLTECCTRIPPYIGTKAAEVQWSELDVLYAAIDPSDRFARAKARAKTLAEALRLYAAGSAGTPDGPQRLERQRRLDAYARRPTPIPPDALALLAEFAALGERIVDKCGTDPVSRAKAQVTIEDLLRRLRAR